MADLSYLSIPKAHELLSTKQISCVELINYYLERISSFDGQLQSLISLNTQEALKQAEVVDQKIANGDDIGMLEGIPYIAKDMFLTEDVQTTAASQILNGFIPCLLYTSRCV